MNKTQLKNRYGLAIKRALVGEITGQDIKAIVKYQLRGYINENQEPFTDVELALLTARMVIFN